MKKLKNKNVVFSIITCTYNAERELPLTLKSIADQEYPHIEHIVQDGCSKDNTLELLKKSVSHVNLKVVSEKDKGLYDAMNKALKHCMGDYVLFLNAGDSFPNSGTLLAIADKLNAGEDYSVVYGDTDIVDSEGHFLRHRHLFAPKSLTSKSFKYGMTVCHQAFWVKRDLAQRVEYELNYRYSADVDWCIRVLKMGEEFGLQTLNMNGVIAHFLDGGMTTKNHRASLIERFKVMSRHYGVFTTILMHVYFLFRK